VWFDERQLWQSGPRQVHALACWEKASLIAIATEVVSVLKAATGELVASWPVEAEALEFVSDGTLVALIRGRMEATRLNLVSGPRKCLGISSSKGPGFMSFSPDSTHIAATHFRCIELWQLEPWKRLARREMPEGMTRMEFVNGDLHLLMEDPPSLLSLRLPELEIVSARTLPFRSVDMVLAGQLALAPEEESIQLHLWDCRSLPPRKLCSLDQYRTVAMESSADGRYLAAVTYQAGTDSPIDLYVWDLDESYSPRHLGEFRYLYGPVFTAQGLVALADGQLRTWEMSTWSAQLGFRPDTPVIGGLVALADGRLLRGNHFLDPLRKTTDLCFDLGEDIEDVAASPDGRWIAVKPRQGAVYVVETPRRPPWA
ncbi:MAG: WD40 repeat domain-containing protein, partial [Candidatus Eremiobacteraeota bacterium]|nr:WD40 repeat domain-containing protein [Candidatus Eremiobacteraeota bacterium]